MFATKSRRRLLDALSGCLIVREDENQALIQWCYASGEVDGGNAYASVDLKIDGPAITVPTHAADQSATAQGPRSGFPEPNPASAP